MNKKLEILLLAALYVGTLYLWTIPIDGLPFGDVDASTHFTLGDYMGQEDTPIYNLPYYISFGYGFENQGKLWYAPQFHLNEGIAQILGGDRIVSLFLLLAVTSSLGVLSVFFVVRWLYGFWPAFIAASLMAVSGRDILTYVLSQWPLLASMVYLPLVLYCYHKYIHEKLTRYLWLMVIFVAFQYFFQPQGVISSFLAVLVYTGIIMFQQKKLPFKIKHALIALIIFAIVMAPFFHFSLNSIFTKATRGTADAKFNVGSLFRWYPPAEQFGNSGPATYFDYAPMHGLWTLPFLFLGLLVIVMRRNKADWLLIAWFVSYYIVIHLDFFGLIPGRINKSMVGEAAIFYPIIAIGGLALPQFLKLGKPIKQYASAGIILLMLGLTFFVNGAAAKEMLAGAYQGIGRITPYQLNSADWIRQNLPEDADIFLAGTVVYAKKKWLRALTLRHLVYDYNAIIPERSMENTSYIYLDYSDLVLLRENPQFGQALAALQQWEAQNLQEDTLLYEDNYAKVYKFVRPKS